MLLISAIRHFARIIHRNYAPLPEAQLSTWSENELTVKDELGNSQSQVYRSSMTQNVERRCACFQEKCTVKPPNKGHIGDGLVVPCREVALFSEVFF